MTLRSQPTARAGGCGPFSLLLSSSLLSCSALLLTSSFLPSFLRPSSSLTFYLFRTIFPSRQRGLDPTTQILSRSLLAKQPPFFPAPPTGTRSSHFPPPKNKQSESQLCFLSFFLTFLLSSLTIRTEFPAAIIKLAVHQLLLPSGKFGAFHRLPEIIGTIARHF